LTRAEMKQLAKDRLGGKIFGNIWLLALLVGLINYAITYAVGSIVPGVGALIIAGPMGYGMVYVFLKLARDGETPKVGDVFKGFSEDFGETLLIGLLSGIFAALWGLLFVIPGIVKSYAYSMAYYIKADHPDYGWKECIDGSRALMKGHKWDLFVLDLSFIGWYIVGSLCLGVGTLWVTPYHMEAKAIFYEQICGEAEQPSYEEDDENGWYTE